jgi:hypothetical protein
MTSFARTLTLVAASALLASVPAAAQTLGDLARQEAARRQTVSSGKVYTNDNLKPAPPVTATVPQGSGTSLTPPPSLEAAGAAPASGAAATTSPETPAQATTAAAPGQDGRRTEAYWRDRLAAARDNLARSQTFQDALQARISALALDFVNRDDPVQRAQVERDHARAMAEMERVKKEAAQYQKEIGDIQEEGRRAGAPAGWLR